MCGGAAPDFRGFFLPGSNWRCLLLRIVLQDALSEVAKLYLPLKLSVFFYDITTLLMEKNKEVAEMAKKAMRKSKEEVEKKGLTKWIAEKEKEGKS